MLNVVGTNVDTFPVCNN